MKSTVPPISVPAWKCYSTGKNPSNLGVYSFLTFDLNMQKYKVAGPWDFHGKDIWDYLEKHNKTSCVFKMFSTYPAKKINGCMVSDFSFNIEGYSPKELKDEIEDQFGPLWFDINFTTDIDGTYFQVLKETEKDFRVLKYLINKYHPNFVHISISHTDGIQHFLWKDMVDNDPKYGDFIRNAWIEIDRLLGEFLQYITNQFQNEIHLFTISDHGFCNVNYRFNIGRWLVERGYLRLTKKGRYYKIIFNFINDIDKIYFLIEKIILVSRKILRMKDIRWGVQTGLSKKFSEQILDFDKSRIIPLEGQILYVNDKAFSDQIEKKEFTLRVIEEISGLKNPDGMPLTKQVFEGKKYYSNKSAPDIIILPNSTHIYNMPLLKTLWSKPHKNKWTGMHDLYGIFIACGSHIKGGYEIENIEIIDIAPTILHIFDIPIPKDMDGRVLRDIFKEDSELANKTIYRREEEAEKQKLKQKIKHLKINRNI